MRHYIFISIATTLLFFTSCNKDNDIAKDDDNAPTVEEVNVNQSALYNKIESAILAFPKEDLDESELAGLLLMREEEKLARDVYKYMHQKYNMKIFENIMHSEEVHMFAIKVMIEKYGLEDPVDNSPAGIFKNSKLQEIYNALITKGDKSLTDALIVGTIIEDLDINDLNDLIEEASNKDLIYVYENLNLGSRNHLRAFYNQVLNNEGEYTPQYISQDEFDAILSGNKEFGNW